MRRSSCPISRRSLLSFGAAFALSPCLAWAQSAKVARMTPDAAYEAAQNQDIVLIDIRRPEEWLQTGVAEGAIGLDMTQPGFVPALLDLRQRYPDRPLAMICRTGNRTNYVTSELAKQGFPGLIDVSEGMVGGRNGPGWLARKLPTYEGRPDAVQTRTDAVLDPKP